MSLANWSPPSRPLREVIRGRYATLEPLSVDHIAGLREAHGEDSAGAMWGYLPVGPFDDAGYRAWVEASRITDDPLHFAVRMADGRLGGTLSLMRIHPDANHRNRLADLCAAPTTNAGGDRGGFSSDEMVVRGGVSPV